MNWDWNLARIKRALLTILVTLALVATITREHLMTYAWVALALVVLIIVAQVVDSLRRDKVVTLRLKERQKQDAKVH